MFARRLAPLLLVLLLGGCAANQRDHLVTADSSVALDEAETAAGSQKRTLPWDKLTLTASVDYEVKLPESEFKSVGVTPGLWAAGGRLKAREAALADLAQQLARLPASEPPPGELSKLNLEDFAARRPELVALLAEQLRTATTEKVQQDEYGKAQLTLEFPVAVVAKQVLERGGGFTPGDAVTSTFGPRARAQAMAKSEAEQKLLRELLPRQATSKQTYAQWVDRYPQNRQRLFSQLAQSRVLRSEETTEADGGKKWVYEIEFDAASLQKYIRDEERKVEKSRSRAKKPAKDASPGAAPTKQ